MNVRKNFIPRNDGFTCEACDKAVPAAQGTSRNHCSNCLTSKHVDELVPGDRVADCGGLMPTIRAEGVSPDAIVLVQRCQQCGKEHRNRTAIDDNRRLLFNEMMFVQ